MYSDINFGIFSNNIQLDHLLNGPLCTDFSSYKYITLVSSKGSGESANSAHLPEPSLLANKTYGCLNHTG